jgi:hypothetical protein
MARAASGKRRGKKATKRKRKVAVSRKTHPPQRGTSDNTPLRVANMPPFQIHLIWTLPTRLQRAVATR